MQLQIHWSLSLLNSFGKFSFQLLYFSMTDLYLALLKSNFYLFTDIFSLMKHHFHPLVFLDTISFSYLNTFNVADLKSLSSKFSIWVSSGTVST